MIYNIPCPIVVSKLKRHDEIKHMLLQLLEQMPSSNIKTARDNITKTDWHLHDALKETYLNFVKPILTDHIYREFEQFNVPALKIENFWFQQYENSDTHDWHIHGGSHWSNVYFLELPDNKLKTQIVNFNNNQLIDYEAIEGDVVSFPAMLYHRSPINDTRFRKSVIAFNMEYCQ